MIINICKQKNFFGKDFVRFFLIESVSICHYQLPKVFLTDPRTLYHTTSHKNPKRNLGCIKNLNIVAPENQIARFSHAPNGLMSIQLRFAQFYNFCPISFASRSDQTSDVLWRFSQVPVRIVHSRTLMLNASPRNMCYRWRNSNRPLLITETLFGATPLPSLTLASFPMISTMVSRMSITRKHD